MRTRIKKGIALILSSVLTVTTFVTTLPKMSLTAYAAGTGKNLQLGSEVLGEECNSNSAATVYFDDSSDVWRVIGYGTTGVASGSGKMTLLANGNMDHGAYDSSSLYSNNYKDSNLQSMTNTLAERLTGIETGAVATKTLTGGSANYGEAGYDSNNISGATVENAVLWPLSVAEANDVNSNLRIVDPDHQGWASSHWLLRSPGSVDDLAAIVSGRGEVNRNGFAVNNNGYGVRPAFNINLSSIILTSAAEGGKNPDTPGTPETPDVYAGTEWKLTIHDEKMIIAEGEAGVTRDGSTITVPYTITGDNAGNTNRVSVLITDKAITEEDAEIQYYGKLAISGTGGIGTSGTGTFTLPDDYDTDWKIYILSEVINDDKKSDYASSPVAITIPDSSGPGPGPAPSPNPSHNDGDSSDNDPSDSGSQPKDEKPFDYLDELRAKLKSAIDLGGDQTVTWDKGTALPYDIMKTLQDNPNITLVFSYTYQGLDYKVTIPGRNAKAFTTIPWYGPLYLFGNYGAYNAIKPVTTTNTQAGNRTYTVISGDTLSGIARKLNTTVSNLVKLNNISDPDRISIGQVIRY